VEHAVIVDAQQDHRIIAASPSDDPDWPEVLLVPLGDCEVSEAPLWQCCEADVCATREGHCALPIGAEGDGCDSLIPEPLADDNIAAIKGHKVDGPVIVATRGTEESIGQERRRDRLTRQLAEAPTTGLAEVDVDDAAPVKDESAEFGSMDREDGNLRMCRKLAAVELLAGDIDEDNLGM
jgi:hypothetical protein